MELGGGAARCRIVHRAIFALRDVTLNWFRHEPHVGQNRLELLTPVITARSFVPIAGEKWSQSTDIYIDIGPSFTSNTGQAPQVGIFASLAWRHGCFRDDRNRPALDLARGGPGGRRLCRLRVPSDVGRHLDRATARGSRIDHR